MRFEETKTQEEEPAVLDVAITVDMLPTIARYEADALQKAEDGAHLRLQHEEDERRMYEEEMKRGEAKAHEKEPAVPLDVAITVDMLPTRVSYDAAAVRCEIGIKRTAVAEQRLAAAKERMAVAKERMAAKELTAVAAATIPREVVIKRIAATEARTVAAAERLAAAAARAAARKKDRVDFRWASRVNSVSPDNGARNDAVPAVRSRQRPLSAGPRLRPSCSAGSANGRGASRSRSYQARAPFR